MNFIAQISHAFYDNNLRGGEGHMEVGKLIHNVVDQKVNMTLSIKPFGCMPSSSVSDGVQSLITELYPAAIFLPIETNGDGAVNVYSRVQMQLFKAKQMALRQQEETQQELGIDEATLKAWITAHPEINQASHRSPHVGACTALDTLHYLANSQQKSWFTRTSEVLINSWGKAERHKTHALAAVERAAHDFKARKQTAVSPVKFVEVS
jgi:hypothetical protein